MLAAYRTRLTEFAAMAPTDIWYYIIDSELLIKTAPNEATRERRIAFEQKARARTADKLLAKLMVQRHGRNEFLDQLPVIERLKPGSDHDDRNLKISSGSFAPFGGSVTHRIRSEDKIDMEPAERDARGLYKLSPKEPLKPGEYGSCGC